MQQNSLIINVKSAEKNSNLLFTLPKQPIQFLFNNISMILELKKNT